MNISEIDKSKCVTGDHLSRIKKSWIGQFYVRHLKGYSVARFAFINGWHLFLSLYSIVKNLFAGVGRWREIVAFSSYVDNNAIFNKIIFNGIELKIAEPQVLPTSDIGLLATSDYVYFFPSIRAAEMAGVVCYGGSNLLFIENSVICHDLYNFKYDYTSEEMHGRHLIDYKNNRFMLLSDDLNPFKIDRAATFLDACSGNYAHWLTEILPRIAIFCCMDEYADVPIVVDAGLHPNIMQSLELVVGEVRPIIILPTGRSIEVQNLVHISVTGYIPFGRRNKKLNNHTHGLFHPLAFEKLNKKLDKYAVKNIDAPNKIYLKRISGHRNIINCDDVEMALKEKGYVVIDAGKFNFIDQLNLIRNATHIVGATGAALANLVFNNNNGKLIVMIGRHRDMSYRYWSNMLNPLGLTVNYILGDYPSKIQPTIHGDFFIELEYVKCFS